MEYFNLDGRSKGVHNFHFVFLNHFRYKDRVSFPFYLKFSSLKGLSAHRKKESRLVLHEGLILLIAKYCRDRSLRASLSYVKKKRQIVKDSSEKTCEKKKAG